MLDSKVWDVWSENSWFYKQSKLAYFAPKNGLQAARSNTTWLFWLHLESFKLNNYGGQIDKIESEAEEEGDIASLEPQTSKVVKINWSVCKSWWELMGAICTSP